MLCLHISVSGGSYFCSGNGYLLINVVLMLHGRWENCFHLNRVAFLEAELRDAWHKFGCISAYKNSLGFSHSFRFQELCALRSVFKCHHSVRIAMLVYSFYVTFLMYLWQKLIVIRKVKINVNILVTVFHYLSVRAKVMNCCVLVCFLFGHRLVKFGHFILACISVREFVITGLAMFLVFN
jgi:hypothetical protein